MRSLHHRTLFGLASASLVLLSGCHTTGGASFLVFGGSHPPQEDLVELVRASGQEASEAREDFSGAFLLYQRLTSPQAVELEDLSADFADSIEDCEQRAQELAEHLEAVRAEAQGLIHAWTEELAGFSSDAMRKKSEAMMRDTDAHAQRVLAALERVQDRVSPVLLKLQDYALFFHHNLNARAIATLEDTYKDFDAEFHALEGELGKAHGEVTAFLSFAEPAPLAPEN